MVNIMSEIMDWDMSTEDREQKTLYRTLYQQNLKLPAHAYDILRTMCEVNKKLYNAALRVARDIYNEGERILLSILWENAKKDEDVQDFKNLLHSQVARKTVSQIASNYKRAFRSESGLPQYKGEHEYSTLLYPKQAFQVKDDHIRIGVMKDLREKYGYDWTHIRIPFTYRVEGDVRMLQIIPREHAQRFEYGLVHTITRTPIDTKIGKTLHINLNSPSLDININTKKLMMTHKKLQNIYIVHRKQEDVPINTERTRYLEHKINDVLNKIVIRIIEYCKEHKIGTINVEEHEGEIHAAFQQKLEAKCERYCININTGGMGNAR